MALTKLKMVQKKKKKFNTFHDFVLGDEDVVMKVLLLMGMWAGNILFSLLVLALALSHNYELAIIIGLISSFGWWKTITFYRLGGIKTMPKMKAGDVVWRQTYGTEKESEKKDTKEESCKEENIKKGIE